MKLTRILNLFMVGVCTVCFASCAAVNTPAPGQITTVEGVPDPGPDAVQKLPENTKEAFDVDESKAISVEAFWEGYTEIKFDEYLKKGFEGLFEENAVTIKTLNVSIQDGWAAKEFLDESTLTEGSTAVSYIAEMTITVDGADAERGVAFYMEMKSDGTMKAVSCEMFVEGAEYGEVYDAEQSKVMLEDFIKYM